MKQFHSIENLDTAILYCLVQAWQQQRDQAHSTINWRFTTADARIKLKRLYPSFT